MDKRQDKNQKTNHCKNNILNCPVLFSSKNSGESSTPCCSFKPMQPTNIPLKNGIRLCVCFSSRMRKSLMEKKEY